MNALTYAGSCPVCGDHFQTAPRRCGNCDTPHHPECWDYLPGCAVFGCAEITPPAIMSWPWSYQVIRFRARLSSFNAHALQIGVLTFLAAVGTGNSVPALISLTLFCAILFAVGLPLQILVEIAYRLSPAHETLKTAVKHGDRRLKTVIERQAGSLVPVGSFTLARIFGALVCMPGLFNDLWTSYAAGTFGIGKIFTMSVALLLVGHFFAILFFPLLWICEKWIGTNTVLLNRLEASLSLPEKPTGP